ncbi:DUF3099 domain-containing protein, partial [Rathayibacter sp. AY1A3]|uniref:DUF3099 domain-containing protein n=1 Tax=Rathayibacter sp. AY1A3 TaxID=2080521 RepID=UPI000D43F47C
MKPRETLTSLPPSPSAERRSRAIKYSIAMGIRMLCVICLLFAHGWWLLFFAIGAVVLPYFAVVLANVGSAGERGNVERPVADEGLPLRLVDAGDLDRAVLERVVP